MRSLEVFARAYGMEKVMLTVFTGAFAKTCPTTRVSC